MLSSGRFYCSSGFSEFNIFSLIPRLLRSEVIRIVLYREYFTLIFRLHNRVQQLL